MAERTDEEEPSTETRSPDKADSGQTDSVSAREDQIAERFLELEADLSEVSEATLPEGTVHRGQIMDANRVDSSEIPDSYPVSVGDGQALVLTVDLVDGGEVQTYLDWPADGDPEEESALGRLLAALGVAPEELASLYGQRVLVEIVDSHYTLSIPAEPPRGADEKTGIVAAHGASMLALTGGVLAGGALSALLWVLFFALTFIVVPYYTYRDSWYLRTHSDWEGGPLFWTALAMVPLLNTLSTALYLSGRRDVTFID